MMLIFSVTSSLVTFFPAQMVFKDIKLRLNSVATYQTSNQDWHSALNTFETWTSSQNLDHWHSYRPRSLVTHLSHPERDFINLVDGHKCLHVVKEEHIVEDGGKQGQRAIEHSGREDALPAAPDAPAHSFFLNHSAPFFPLCQAAIISRPGRPRVTTSS